MVGDVFSRRLHGDGYFVSLTVREDHIRTQEVQFSIVFTIQNDNWDKAHASRVAIAAMKLASKAPDLDVRARVAMPLRGHEAWCEHGRLYGADHDELLSLWDGFVELATGEPVVLLNGESCAALVAATP